MRAMSVLGEQRINLMHQLRGRAGDKRLRALSGAISVTQ
jgi:hypothetical protein